MSLRPTGESPRLKRVAQLVLEVQVRWTGSLKLLLFVAVGVTNTNMNKTYLMEPNMEEDSGLVAGIAIAVGTFVLIILALVSETGESKFISQEDVIVVQIVMQARGCFEQILILNPALFPLCGNGKQTKAMSSRNS